MRLTERTDTIFGLSVVGAAPTPQIAFPSRRWLADVHRLPPRPPASSPLSVYRPENLIKVSEWRRYYWKHFSLNSLLMARLDLCIVIITIIIVVVFVDVVPIAQLSCSTRLHGPNQGA